VAEGHGQIKKFQAESSLTNGKGITPSNQHKTYTITHSTSDGKDERDTKPSS
jgi:hypothetical protein